MRVEPYGHKLGGREDTHSSMARRVPFPQSSLPANIDVFNEAILCDGRRGRHDGRRRSSELEPAVALGNSKPGTRLGVRHTADASRPVGHRASRGATGHATRARAALET